MPKWPRTGTRSKNKGKGTKAPAPDQGGPKPRKAPKNLIEQSQLMIQKYHIEAQGIMVQLKTTQKKYESLHGLVQGRSTCGYHS